MDTNRGSAGVLADAELNRRRGICDRMGVWKYWKLVSSKENAFAIPLSD
jgi:hypothetical protein